MKERVGSTRDIIDVLSVTGGVLGYLEKTLLSPLMKIPGGCVSHHMRSSGIIFRFLFIIRERGLKFLSNVG